MSTNTIPNVYHTHSYVCSFYLVHKGGKKSYFLRQSNFSNCIGLVLHQHINVVVHKELVLR